MTWEYWFGLIGAVGGLFGILAIGYNSLRSHISTEIERNLGNSTVEDRVAEKISDKLIHTADLINRSESRLESIGGSINEVEITHEELTRLTSKLSQDFKIVVSAKETLQSQIARAESDALSLINRLNSTDDLSVERVKALITLVEEANTPIQQLLDIQHRIDAISNSSLLPENYEWSNDYVFAATSEEVHGGIFSEQKPQIRVDQYGNLHLRGTLMRNFEWSGDINELRQNYFTDIDKEHEKQIGWADKAIVYLPSDYSPNFPVRVVAASNKGPVVLDIDPNRWFNMPTGESYVPIRVLSDDWYLISLDGITFSTSSPTKAFQRYSKQ